MRQSKCTQRHRALNVELTQLKQSVVISQIPQKCEKLAKTSLSHIFLDILGPRLLFALYTEFRCHARGIRKAWFSSEVTDNSFLVSAVDAAV